MHLLPAHSTRSATRPRIRFGMVSTYPPTVCGLATFSSALERALVSLGHGVDVVQVVDVVQGDEGDAVSSPAAAVLRHGSAASIEQAAARLSTCDVVLVQHEFGIYGGRDGEEVVDLVRAIQAPQVVVLHTVLSRPSANQFRIVEALAESAEALVVMSECARARLLAVHTGLDPTRVIMIPHGAQLADQVTRPWSIPTLHGPELLTWGLIGPGKGIEHVMRAVAALRDEGVALHYTVAGMTHPKVRRAHGERYRDSLRALARDLRIEPLVAFDTEYRDVTAQTRFIASAALVVMAYDTTEQVTSGVLVDSLAAGRPVIATAFPHAVELLAGGAGLLVRHGDHAGLVRALRHGATDVRLRTSMTRSARAMSPTLSWDSVASSYAGLSGQIMSMHRPVTA